MSDIIERLLAAAHMESAASDHGVSPAGELLKNAADEIKRLRAESKELALKVLQAESQTCEAMDDLTAAYMSGSHDGERKGYRRGLERAAEIANTAAKKIERIGARHPEDSSARGRCFARSREASQIAAAIRKEIDQ